MVAGKPCWRKWQRLFRAGTEKEDPFIEILTSVRMPIERFDDVPVNTEHYNIGASWTKGFYIIKVRRGDRIDSFHVVKD